jgi:hypothetical protein
MTKVVLDAALRAKLNGLDKCLELCDEQGLTLGYFHPLARADGTGARSVFSREELERRRQQRTGRPLAEILERLNQL